MLPVALVHSPGFTGHDAGQIRVDGNNLYHVLAGQEHLDPVYTMDKIQFPFPVSGPVLHPETSARYTAILEALKSFGLLESFTQVEPEPVPETLLESVHRPEYINKVKQVSAAGGFLAEATYVSPGSYETALLSAGSAITAARLVLEGRYRSAFSLGRPPGHHAGPARAGGFCLFNNAALAARYCLDEGGCERVLILDWDLHHGDGTQEIVEADPRITFCSIHQFGPELYPETGAHHETGSNGNIINVPLPAMIGDFDYLAVFRAVVPPVIRQLRPDVVIVSAGFDGHFNDVNHLYLYDPGAGFCLTAQLYHELAKTVAELAAEVNGRYIMLLEGGYDLQNLSYSVANTLAAMRDLPPVVEEYLPPQLNVLSSFNLREYLEELNRAHQGKWHFAAES